MSDNDFNGGYFSVRNIWQGRDNKEAINTQGNIWDKIDAIGVFMMRFYIIIWLISIIISIIAIILGGVAISGAK